MQQTAANLTSLLIMSFCWQRMCLTLPGWLATRADHPVRCCRRLRSAPPELTELERLQYRSVVYGLAAAINVPQARLGRDRFSMAAQVLSLAA